MEFLDARLCSVTMSTSSDEAGSPVHDDGFQGMPVYTPLARGRPRQSITDETLQKFRLGVSANNPV